MAMHNSSVSDASQPRTVRFRCPGCQSELQTPIQHAGKPVRCGRCQMQLVVPQPAAASALSASSGGTDKVICICGDCKTVIQTPSNVRRVNCSKCGGTFELPEKDGYVSASKMFRFRCSACGQAYGVLLKYAGKKISCLKCRGPLVIPVPAKPKPDTDSIQLLRPQLDTFEEVKDAPEPRLYDEVSRVPSDVLSQARRSRGVSRRGDAEGEPKKSGLKLPLMIVGGLAGFVIAFWVVSALVGPAVKETSGGVTVQSPQALSYAEQVVRQLVQKEVDPVIEALGEEADQLAVRTLSRMLATGTLDRVESEVIYSNIESGAAGYGVRSRAIFSDGAERRVEMGFCILEVWDEWGENVTAEHHLMNLQLMDSEGSLQYATGQTDADLLKAQMDTMVEENKGPGEVSVAIILPIVLVAVVLVIVSLIAQVKVFSDCGEAGWAVFVPVYREVCLARMADKSEGLGWLCGFSNFIPFGGVIYLGLMCLFSIGIAAHYGRGFLFGLGLAILPFIFYPILAFSGK